MRVKLSCFLVLHLAQAQGATEDPIQKVIISGSQTDVDAGRDFVAGKIIIGKQRIAESGLQNVGELLNREPAVSVGKNGTIGLLGLPGYTQLLVDGMPPQGDIFSIDLIHIERIEIIKSSTAATGPVGIAGTINIIRRKTERKASTQLRAGATTTAGRLGGDVAWSTNQLASGSSLSYNLRLSAFRKPIPNRSDYTQERIPFTGIPSLQFNGHLSAPSVVQGVTASSELTWALSADHKLSFSPDVGYITNSQDSQEQRLWSDGRSLFIQQKKDNPIRSYSLPLRWDWRIDPDSNLSVKLNMNRSALNAKSLSSENVGGEVFNQREHIEEKHNKNYFLNFDLITALENGHEVTAGMKLVRNDSDATYADFINGQSDYSLAMLDPGGATRVARGQLFLQDEWRINRTWALNAGLSFERRIYKLYEGSVSQSTNFDMWAPSMHVSKKIGGNKRHQLRFSVARSFRPPFADEMLLRPRINAFSSCQSQKLCGANTLDTADITGNPNLRPERALGLNLSYAYGIGKDSELLVEVYSRDIRNKTGAELVLENVAWAGTSRYLYRQANLGKATVRGLNLDARLSGKDVWAKLSDLELHGSIGLTHSKLNDLPGPNNSIAGQSPWSAKIGGTYAVQVVPMRLGFDVSFLPGDLVRDNINQRVFESSKLSARFNSSWNIDNNATLLLNLDNLTAKTRSRVDEYLQGSTIIQRSSNTTDDVRISIRIERKL